MIIKLLLRRHRRNPARLRWYRVVYRLAYRLGLTIWERPTPPADLVTLVEGPSALRPRRALDLGCGTGTDTIYLATHGWEVTAIDMVPKALAAARRNATAAGVAPRFIEGDVTRLHDLGVGDGYTLLVDFGCFHTLPEDRRPAYVTSVSQAATSRARLLLYGFSRPPKAAPMRADLTVEEVRQRFSHAGWELLSAERASAEALGIGVRRADDRFELWCYQLQRLSS
ncbi:class I SAM-dependent methyltransferase [Nonomuraea turcica]|uniref:class I SAM-dependent methyltransferase n=1 Tax=Nonomuraea sp. G32 TaxID=3067274 RepID=UPI00273C7566|nr:class I SAM-dependent methyltransferase [Nonomuraea sp. G32]MDP4510051.1 methyltransferase domain-containing protein [Nonomuraea sp. G32]